MPHFSRYALHPGAFTLRLKDANSSRIAGKRNGRKRVDDVDWDIHIVNLPALTPRLFLLSAQHIRTVLFE